MKKKRTATVLLVAALMILSAGCGILQKEAPSQETGIPNPVKPISSFRDLMTAAPEINMSDAPSGSEGVIYSLITDGVSPAIAQIEFRYQGNEYCYRAAACRSEASMKDISGVYSTFSSSEVLSVKDGGVEIGQIRLQTSSGSSKGLATWFCLPTKCQYSLFSETAANGNKDIQKTAGKLFMIRHDKNGNPLQYLPESTPEPKPEPEPTEEPVEEKPVSVVIGTVIKIGDGKLTIKMSNGNSLTFGLTQAGQVQAAPGDVVRITYYGDVLDSPAAETVEVTQKSSQSVSGTIVQYTASNLYLRRSDGNIFGFTITNDTVVTGAASTLSVNAVVTVYYTGVLSGSPVAVSVQIEKNGHVEPEPTIDPSLINKKLNGTVYQLSRKKLSIETNSGHRYSFVRTEDTEYSGSYPLELGCTVRVTYDGYASKTPDAKVIKVTAPPEPVPPKPVYHHAEGYVEDFGGMNLRLNNGMDFDVSYASHSGNAPHQAGSYATVTYYVEGGRNYATRIVWDLRVMG